jgi:DNA-binding transcriptional regulator Cro
MTAEEIYQYFGSAYSAAKAIGITKQAFSKWIEKRFVPFNRQIAIQKITKGKLVAKEEDARKYQKDETKVESTYLPNFRYYDKNHGMCRVESIHFRKGKRPKITYMIEGNNTKKFTVFSTTNLMQASDLLDSKGIRLYEGDICLINKCRFIFNNIEMTHEFKEFGKFKIIGNIFDDKK